MGLLRIDRTTLLFLTSTEVSTQHHSERLWCFWRLMEVTRTQHSRIWATVKHISEKYKWMRCLKYRVIANRRRMFQGVSRCLRVSQGVSGCLRVSQGVSGCLRVSQGVSRCFRVSHGVSGCLKVYQGVSGCLRVSQGVSGCLSAQC